MLSMQSIAVLSNFCRLWNTPCIVCKGCFCLKGWFVLIFDFLGITMNFSEIGTILNLLETKLLSWLGDVESLFIRMPKKLTASINWNFVNKQLERHIEKWYLLVQDAFDDIEVVLYEQNQTNLTPEIEEYIRIKFDPVLKKFQESGKELVFKYKHFSSNVNSDTWQELLDILFEVKIDNIINILKEMLDECYFEKSSKN